ncbi:sensor histidine kinase [Phormidesmis priestleyi]|uniref:sensor histidine kinase n=1 Tax=Phormidesmis priestleyi TaxID=268141 RepID=UPI001E3E6830|nr:ATP-binding protein [Phormidesmis priestleyi]
MFSKPVNDAHLSLMPPILLEGSTQALTLESTLQELPLYQFQADLSCLGIEMARVFEQHPLLPGVIFVEQERFVGMISRQQLLEYLLRPHGVELFLSLPLQVLSSYAPKSWLMLANTTSILSAAQQALQRSPECLADPIVVQHSSGYHLLDVHTLNIAYWQIRGIETQVRYERLQLQMLQSEKMASLGRLVDGVAHEILDPVSFIWGNLSHVSDYSQNLLALVAAYQKALPQPTPEIAHIQNAIELDYLRDDLPKTLDSIKTGAERLSKLVNGLQNFCHIDEVYPKPADLNECLNGVLLLLKSRMSSEIEIVKHYGQLPPVPCFVGQLSQVFMNLLSRSIDGLLNQAVGDRLSSESTRDRSSKIRPRITVTTDLCTLRESDTRWVSIRISDNGGITSETQHQLIEAFANDQPFAKETSLTTSYRIITARHGGKFRVFSRIHACGTGTQEPTSTEFEILLPVA